MTIIYQWRLSADREMLLYLRRRPGQKGSILTNSQTSQRGSFLASPSHRRFQLVFYPPPPLLSPPTPVPQTLGGWWVRVEKRCGGSVGNCLLWAGVRVACSTALSAVWVSWTCSLTPFPLALSRSSCARGRTQWQRNGLAGNQQASRFVCGYRARIWGSTLSPLLPPPQHDILAL